MMVGGEQGTGAEAPHATVSRLPTPDLDPFTDFYRAHQPELVRIATLIVGSRPQAEDLGAGRVRAGARQVGPHRDARALRPAGGGQRLPVPPAPPGPGAAPPRHARDPGDRSRRRASCSTRSNTCRSASGPWWCCGTTPASRSGRRPRRSGARPGRWVRCCTAPWPACASRSNDEPEEGSDARGRCGCRAPPCPRRDHDGRGCRPRCPAPRPRRPRPPHPATGPSPHWCRGRRGCLLAGGRRHRRRSARVALARGVGPDRRRGRWYDGTHGTASRGLGPRRRPAPRGRRFHRPAEPPDELERVDGRRPVRRLARSLGGIGLGAPPTVRRRPSSCARHPTAPSSTCGPTGSAPPMHRSRPTSRLRRRCRAHAHRPVSSTSACGPTPPSGRCATSATTRCRPGRSSPPAAWSAVAEGEPRWVVIAQVTPGVSDVRVTFPDGHRDHLAPVDGIVVLTAPVDDAFDLATVGRRRESDFASKRSTSVTWWPRRR